MLTRSEQAKQRWAGVDTTIDTWLLERQNLLIEYFKLAGLPPYERESQALPAKHDISNFCSLLMDYISAGHFEVYEQIIKNSRSAPESTQALAEQLFPLISETTDLALDFNDRYGQLEHDHELDNFDQALSGLGEVLEMRMKFEDQLLHTLEQHELL